MPQFTYKAKLAPGKIQDGVIQADNKQSAVKKLRVQGLYPFFIAQTTGQPTSIRRGRIREKDVASFTRQLTNLLRAGFPLTHALATLSVQERNNIFKRLIDDIHNSIQKGATFSEALGIAPSLFSSFYIDMVKIGESTGKIDDTLDRLADFKEKEGELLAQLKSALIYPAFVLGVGILTVFFMVTFFIPRLSGIFAEMGQTLPLLTRVVMAASAFMSHTWIIFVVLAAALVFTVRRLYRHPGIRLRMEELLIKIPLAGPVILKIETARFCYAFSVLLRNSVPMLTALEIIDTSSSNSVLHRKLKTVQDKIRRGHSLSSCLHADPIFSPILINMVALGEESGTLAEMFEKAAAIFEKEIILSVKNLVSLIEPVLIIVVGILVMILVFAMLLPVFQMNLSVR